MLRLVKDFRKKYEKKEYSSIENIVDDFIIFWLCRNPI